MIYIISFNQGLNLNSSYESIEIDPESAVHQG